MTNFEKSMTYQNLARGFAAECQAGARYQFLAQKCKMQGYDYLQTLLKTIAKNEMAHAKVFYDCIINNSTKTVDNIEINGGYPFKDGTVEEAFLYNTQNELSESENIYPGFAKIANDEGYKDIANKFTLVADVETCHKLLLEQIWQKLKAKKLYKSPTAIKWKCSNCGHEATLKEAWTKCPLCEMEQGYVEVPLDLGKKQ